MATETIVRRDTSRRRRRRRRRRRFPLLPVCLLILAVVVGARLLGRDKTPPTQPPAEPSAPTTEPSPMPAARPDDWRLTLVNRDNFLPEDYAIETVTLTNGLQVDRRCYPDLQEMIDACREAGLTPVICSAYRPHETQKTLFQNKVNALRAQGYSEEEAEAEAGTVVAIPGTSEHELGLALDIVDMNYQTLDDAQEDTRVQKWLMEHSWEYGFILRYPTDKSAVTGIIYEPWHYRYVGRENAAEIHARGVCLEEYLGAAGA